MFPEFDTSSSFNIDWEMAVNEIKSWGNMGMDVSKDYKLMGDPAYDLPQELHTLKSADTYDGIFDLRIALEHVCTVMYLEEVENGDENDGNGDENVESVDGAQESLTGIPLVFAFFVVAFTVQKPSSKSQDTRC